MSYSSSLFPNHNPSNPSYSNTTEITSSWNNIILSTALYATTNKSADLDMCINYLNVIQTFLTTTSNNNKNGNHDNLLDETPSLLPPPPPSPIDIYFNKANNANNNNSNSNAPLNSRRILIRILTTLSEMNALQAMRYGKYREWQNGANSYTISYNHVNHALKMADEEFVKLLSYQQQQQQISFEHEVKQLQKALSNDCNIIHLANTHIANERDKFLSHAINRQSYLQNKLQPQWQSRNKIKSKIGISKWKNNPNPKNDYSSLRENDEKELKEIANARVQLDTLNCHKITLKVNDMLEGIRREDSYYHGGDNGIIGHNHNNSDDIPDDNGSHTQQQQQQLQHEFDSDKRYNGIRPIQNIHHPRVAFEEYPDATNFGWIFTGSCDESFVEFFEKTFIDEQDDDDNNAAVSNNGLSYIVKLDFYYTTGSVKTSLYHPIQGQTQLFGLGKAITPDLYRKILLNPRVHTNVRYQTRRKNQNHHRGGRKGRNRRGGYANRNNRRGRGGRGRWHSSG